jgi:hypothetical protein
VSALISSIRAVSFSPLFDGLMQAWRKELKSISWFGHIQMRILKNKLRKI